jgi:hypothetical protein
MLGSERPLRTGVSGRDLQGSLFKPDGLVKTPSNPSVYFG